MGVGFRVEDLGLRVWGIGFRIEGSVPSKTRAPIPGIEETKSAFAGVRAASTSEARSMSCATDG